MNVLYNYLEANNRIPWEDLRYLFGKFKVIKNILALEQNQIPIFCFVKISKVDFIFSPALHLIIWVLILTKKFEKIAILKI